MKGTEREQKTEPDSDSGILKSHFHSRTFYLLYVPSLNGIAGRDEDGPRDVDF